ncbi:uncharacterized protein LOC129033806 [Pongo pygmaeus]|uniref:uncharacterized protein LOC129033806 n=1 Tax=Pongo pygmaeus TaxID=9600 RepID=UPI00300CB415
MQEQWRVFSPIRSSNGHLAGSEAQRTLCRIRRGGSQQQVCNGSKQQWWMPPGPAFTCSWPSILDPDLLGQGRQADCKQPPRPARPARPARQGAEGSTPPAIHPRRRLRGAQTGGGAATRSLWRRHPQALLREGGGSGCGCSSSAKAGETCPEAEWQAGAGTTACGAALEEGGGVQRAWAFLRSSSSLFCFTCGAEGLPSSYSLNPPPPPLLFLSPSVCRALAEAAGPGPT